MFELAEYLSTYHDVTNVKKLLTNKKEYSKYQKLSLERAKQLGFNNIMKIYEGAINVDRKN